ncbi:MAG: hypothetical protein R6X34_27410 [Chloroflexota bacterium]
MLNFLRRYRYGLSLVLLPLGLAVWLYAPTLPLPYFWDDFPNFYFADAKSYLDVWVDVTGLPYYRPVVFTFNKLAADVTPVGASWAPHLFLLLVHVANSILLGKTAGWFFLRAGKSEPHNRFAVELITAVLFVTYPFAVLPVAHFAAATHLLVLLFTLLGVTAVLQYARSQRKWWAALALACALLSAFTHEAGIMAGAVMALAYLLYDWRLARRQWWLLLALPLASALFLPVWLAVPKTDNESIALELDSPELALMKTSFFFQGPTYPFQPLAAWLMAAQGWRDLTAIWVVGGLFLALAALLLGRGGQWRILLLGLGWMALTMLPSVVALPYDYISISPRLLYYTGVGGALIWGAALVTAVITIKRGWLKTAVAAALAAATLIVPAAYVRRETALHQFALAPLAQMAEMAQQSPEANDIVVNTVNWLAYKRPWYPIGNDGVAVLAPYLTVLDLIELNSGVAWQPTVATFPEIRPDLADYYLATANEREEEWWHMERFTQEAYAHDKVWLTVYEDNGRSQVIDAGQIEPGSAEPAADYQASYEDKVYLTDSSFSVADDVLTITLDWVYTGPDPQATIFRNAFDCAGNLVGEGSGFALERMLPFTFLTPGTRIRDVKQIPLTAQSADGCYQVEVGLFRSNGSRLPAYAPDGSEWANQLFMVRQ